MINEVDRPLASNHNEMMKLVQSGAISDKAEKVVGE